MSEDRAIVSQELEPCPFCGGGAVIYASSDHSTAWEGGCGNEQCRICPQVWELTKAEAIAAWNTRARTAVEAAISKEREECAKLAEAELGECGYSPPEDGNASEYHNDACRTIAAAIRARK